MGGHATTAIARKIESHIGILPCLVYCVIVQESRLTIFIPECEPERQINIRNTMAVIFSTAVSQLVFCAVFWDTDNFLIGLALKQSLSSAESYHPDSGSDFPISARAANPARGIGRCFCDVPLGGATVAIPD